MVRNRVPKSPQPEAPVTPADERGLDFAWRTHTAITDWTARVDAKASIVLSLGGILLGFFVTLTGAGRLLSNLTGWHLIVGRTGLGVCALGVLLAALVVMPRLNRRQADRIWKDNYVYFGHLRRWSPDKLQKALLDQTLEKQLTVLAKQLVTTSDIAWKKHSLLQYAMVALAVGVALVTIGTVWPR